VHLVSFDLLAQGFSRTQEVKLANELFESFGPHAIGQRPLSVGRS
jgi:hypothetical protein